MNDINTCRLICLDVETTGLNNKIDKIIELGCVDITNGFANKKTFQRYINPGKHIPEAVSKIHGITNETVKNFLSFKDYSQDFLDFIKDATLIIHNAIFDISFLNAELSRCQLPILCNKVIDTLKISKEKFPGQKASLEALMNRFKITVERKKHGALLDAEILAQIYIAMTQNQTSLELSNNEIITKKTKPNPIFINLNKEEKKFDNSFFEKIK